MKALLAFLIEAGCFAGLVYFYIQHRQKEQAKREVEKREEDGTDA